MLLKQSSYSQETTEEEYFSSFENSIYNKAEFFVSFGEIL